MASDEYYAWKNEYETASGKYNDLDDAYHEARNSGNTDLRNQLDTLRSQERERRDRAERNMWDADR